MGEEGRDKKKRKKGSDAVRGVELALRELSRKIQKRRKEGVSPIPRRGHRLLERKEKRERCLGGEIGAERREKGGSRSPSRSREESSRRKEDAPSAASSSNRGGRKRYFGRGEGKKRV